MLVERVRCDADGGRRESDRRSSSGSSALARVVCALCAVRTKTARESALKYLILSSTATALLLYGTALLFGATGSVMLADLRIRRWRPARCTGWAPACSSSACLQAEPGAVPYLGARRLRRRAASGDRVHERRHEGRGARGLARFTYAALPPGIARSCCCRFGSSRASR